MVKKKPDGSDRRRNEMKTRKFLKEREKELQCLYQVSSIIENEEMSSEKKLSCIVSAIPDALQYSNDACARIVVDGREMATANFSVSPWKASKELKIKGKTRGILEVYYLKEKPRADHGPFLQQELQLLGVLAERISTFIDHCTLSKHVSASSIKEKPDWQVILDLLAKTDPALLFRVTRKMVYHLSRNQNESLVGLMQNLRCTVDHTEKPSEWCGINMPNPKQDMESLQVIQKNVFLIAQQSMPSEEITNLLELWLKQDKVRPLILASENSGVTLMNIRDVLNKVSEIPAGELMLSPEDDISIRTNLLRRFFTEKLNYINIAKHFVSVQDFIQVIKNVIGPSQGTGRLGGKTAGIFLAQKIVEKERKNLNDPELNAISFARSWYITSDTNWEIIRYNDLDEVIHTKYMPSRDIKAEQPFLEQVFKHAAFPSEIVEGLRKILREIGDKPVIVRSSSLLEDSFEAAFSGKYKSMFLANQGTDEERLTSLIDAIAEVYASTFNPDPIEYRKEKGLLDYTEAMAILIQEVVGRRVGPYYLPVFAGVAFCNNEFRWSARIQRSDGIVRIVAGLGTRAVDRVAGDYPVLFSPRRPNIRVNAVDEETIRYSQQFMDVINIEKATPETISVNDFFASYADVFPQLTQVVSIRKDKHLFTPTSIILYPKQTDMVVTFSGLIEKGMFIKQINWLLTILSERMGTPVDVEFACDGEKIYILQCRPQVQSAVTDRVRIPSKILEKRMVFSAQKYVTNGQIRNIRYLVVVEPEAYTALEKREDMLHIVSIVSHLNEVLPKHQFILMGPGRWGSRGDIKLGVPVQYRDINNTALLVEIARKKQESTPDLSFGTHFFQDLVEAHIHYLPLYPDDDHGYLNGEMLDTAPNKLVTFAPHFQQYAHVVKVIDVSDIAQGGTLSVDMDGDENKAVAYVVPTDHRVWRIDVVTELAERLHARKYGVVALYVFDGSKKKLPSTHAMIDVLVHFRGSKEQAEDLLAWFEEQECIIKKNHQRRIADEVTQVLSVHLVTDEDIKNNTVWASYLHRKKEGVKKVAIPYPGHSATTR